MIMVNQYTWVMSFFHIIEEVIMYENDSAKYTWAMFFFHIIEEVIMYENDCGKSIYSSNAFLVYYYILII